MADLSQPTASGRWLADITRKDADPTLRIDARACRGFRQVSRRTTDQTNAPPFGGEPERHRLAYAGARSCNDDSVHTAERIRIMKR